MNGAPKLNKRFSYCQGWKTLRFKFFLRLYVYSTKTDVAKHESVTQKHLKSASHRTHTVVYTYATCIFLFMDYSIRKIK